MSLCQGTLRTRAAKVRFVAPDQPGYGQSPPLPPEAVPSIPLVTERLVTELKDLGVEHADLVVGWSGGGHYALSLAAAHPELVGALALVGTPAPDEAVPWIPDEFRPALEAMRAEPANALGMLLAALDGTAPSPALVCGGPADDAALRANRRFARRVDQMLERAFTQGCAGMATDLVAQHLSPWGFEASDVRQPVELVYGDADPMVGLDHGRYWASALPNANLQIVEGAGHLVVRHAWNELLNEGLSAATDGRP